MARVLETEIEAESGDLEIVSEVVNALARTGNLQTALHQALKHLSNYGAVRSSVSLLRVGSSKASLESSFRMAGAGELAPYTLSEEITGRVIQFGKPLVVRQVSKDPMFFHRAPRSLRDQEITFICVPIAVGAKPVGTLRVDLEYRRDRDYEKDLRFLNVVATMMGQAVKVHCLLDAERERLAAENVHLKEELRKRYDSSNIIGNSARMREVYEQILQVASGNITVLLRGESGTGKELIAHAIHYSSARAKAPFVRVSCAALPDGLIESELFGHEEGAVTGASMRKRGRFEMAEGGTLFLDEIGDISPAIQARLLRVLQEREYERLGGKETIKADVRIITATHKDLEAAIAAGTFRKDLYELLNAFSIFVPPLRERNSDIMLLAEGFLARYSRKHGREIKRISTPAIDMLTSYHWPGNVRELQNTMERAVLVCDGRVIHGHHLPPSLQTADASGTVVHVSMPDAVAAYEKDLIQDALKTSRGNRARAAKLLEITERIINYKIRKYEIDPDRFRANAVSGTWPRERIWETGTNPGSDPKN